MAIYVLKHSWFNRSLENFVFKNWYLWHKYQYDCHMSISTLLLIEVLRKIFRLAYLDLSCVSV
jgi:hypothetical protein